LMKMKTPVGESWRGFFYLLYRDVGREQTHLNRCHCSPM